MRLKSPSAFQALNQFQLLVAIRKGAFGVEMVNAFITQLLHNEMLLPRAQDLSQWFAGRVVMISENNYDLNIFNGDVGIALPHEGKLRVAFCRPRVACAGCCPAVRTRNRLCYDSTQKPLGIYSCGFAVAQ